MHVCINCGSDKVERQGDDFTCHKCQFQWDVAFEQANKTYLRSQGRQPAKSVLEVETPEAETLKETQGKDGAPVITPDDPNTPPVVNEQESSGKVEVLPDVPTPKISAETGPSPLAVPTPKLSGKKANS